MNSNMPKDMDKAVHKAFDTLMDAVHPYISGYEVGRGRVERTDNGIEIKYRAVVTIPK